MPAWLAHWEPVVRWASAAGDMEPWRLGGWMEGDDVLFIVSHGIPPKQLSAGAAQWFELCGRVGEWYGHPLYRYERGQEP